MPLPPIPLDAQQQQAAAKQSLKQWWTKFTKQQQAAANASGASSSSKSEVSPTNAGYRAVFGVPLTESLKYAGVAISMVGPDGVNQVYGCVGFVPLVLACGTEPPRVHERGLRDMSLHTDISCRSVRHLHTFMHLSIHPTTYLQIHPDSCREMRTFPQAEGSVKVAANSQVRELTWIHIHSHHSRGSLSDIRLDPPHEGTPRYLR